MVALYQIALSLSLNIYALIPICLSIYLVLIFLNIYLWKNVFVLTNLKNIKQS